MSSIPSDLYYSKDHEWVRLEDGFATIGITDFAQQELGDVVYVELPEIETELEAGEPFGSVESVKSVSDIFAPVSGVVVETNTELEERPELVNEDCYGDGWMVRVRLSADFDPDKLLDAEGYSALIEESL